MEEVVIVGAGIAGLATSVALHRLGIRSLVLESAEFLRSEGFGFATWTNAWRALDAIGIADILRAKHQKLTGIVTTSVITGLATSQVLFSALDLPKVLIETLENELPNGTIRYSSKVVQIQNADFYKNVHLADGTVLRTKVLIGCDGVNSVVAKFLGFSMPSFVGRSAIRGFVEFKDGHGLGAKFMKFSGDGIKYGIIPCDDHGAYWFFSYSPNEVAEDPAKMKEYIMSKLGIVSNEIRAIFENTDLNNMISTPVRSCYPWELLYQNISKDNVCIVGDALHPMTPDIGQGACSSLEDSIVLARVLGEALLEKSSGFKEENEKNKRQRIREGLEKFARERKWRSFDLVSCSYVMGVMQQSDGVVMTFFRDKMLAKFLGRTVLIKSDFDCGKLTAA